MCQHDCDGCLLRRVPTHVMFVINSYTLVEPIGAGASATVWRARCSKIANSDYAIKIIDLDKFTSGIEELRKEIQMMASCSHPNIVTYHQCFIHDTELWLVMPFFSGGKLNTWLYV